MAIITISNCQNVKPWDYNHIWVCYFYRLSFGTSAAHHFDDISARVVLRPRPKIRCDVENRIMNITLCSKVEVKRRRGKSINTNVAIITAIVVFGVYYGFYTSIIYIPIYVYIVHIVCIIILFIYKSVLCVKYILTYNILYYYIIIERVLSPD